MFPSSEKMERLVSGICALSKHKMRSAEEKGHGSGHSWQAEPSTKKHTTALPSGKGDVRVGCRHRGENTSSSRPETLKGKMHPFKPLTYSFIRVRFQVILDKQSG